MRRYKPIFFALDARLVRRHRRLVGLIAGFQAVILLVVLAVSFLSNANHQALAASYTWDGGGLTNNWSDCDNWSTNICPVAADSVTFNGTSTKDSTIDSSWGGGA